MTAKRTAVMGILNVTPDSFSDGGQFSNQNRALEHALAMERDGADLLDIGGESTRPGAAEVSADEEIGRVVPLIEQLAQRCRVPISIDTRKAAVAAAALDAGATIVNDVSAMGDPEMAPLVAERGVPVILMHMRGEPSTMQRQTSYDDIVSEVHDYLLERATFARSRGIEGDKIVLDPGIGFGKSTSGNLKLLRALPGLVASGYPVLVGASRKNFIGDLLGGAPVGERLEGSLAVAAWASQQGARFVRVHDVKATVRALQVLHALQSTENDDA